MAVFFHFLHAVGRFPCRLPTDLPIPIHQQFRGIPEYAGTFGVQHANILISLSFLKYPKHLHPADTFLPETLRHQAVMLIAMLAWVLRFGLFGFGQSRSGVWMFILSMIVYGVAFDFFNISGSFVC